MDFLHKYFTGTIFARSSALGLGRKFSLSFFCESFREIHFLFSRKILYEKTKVLRKFSRKQNFRFRENSWEKINQRQIFFISIDKNIGKESEQRENDVVLQQISLGWGRKFSI
jgi:hypothetical protein